MNALLLARVLIFATVATAFPVAALLVFGFGFDRDITADVLSCIYAFGIVIALSTAFWPLACIRDWSGLRRIESLALVFLGMSYFTHLTWELGWLILRDTIAVSADAPWAYTWWAYIDGGDMRYAEPTSTLIGMEILSVTNGAIGAIALFMFLRAGRQHPTALLVLSATAVVHLYSTSLYYLTEFIDGMPSVDTTSFIGTWIKFGLANLSWFVVPWFVLYWAWKRLTPR